MNESSFQTIIHEKIYSKAKHWLNSIETKRIEIPSTKLEASPIV